MMKKKEKEKMKKKKKIKKKMKKNIEKGKHLKKRFLNINIYSFIQLSITIIYYLNLI